MINNDNNDNMYDKKYKNEIIETEQQLLISI